MIDPNHMREAVRACLTSDQQGPRGEGTVETARLVGDVLDHLEAQDYIVVRRPDDIDAALLIWVGGEIDVEWVETPGHAPGAWVVPQPYALPTLTAGPPTRAAQDVGMVRRWARRLASR